MRISVKKISAKCGMISGGIRNIEIEGRKLVAIVSIPAPNPCCEPTASAEVSGNSLIISLDLRRGRGICVQCLAVITVALEAEIPEGVKEVKILAGGTEKILKLGV